MGHVDATNVVKQKLGELDRSALRFSTVNKPQTDGTTFIVVMLCRLAFGVLRAAYSEGKTCSLRSLVPQACL